MDRRSFLKVLSGTAIGAWVCARFGYTAAVSDAATAAPLAAAKPGIWYCMELGCNSPIQDFSGACECGVALTAWPMPRSGFRFTGLNTGPDTGEPMDIDQFRYEQEATPYDAEVTRLFNQLTPEQYDRWTAESIEYH